MIGALAWITNRAAGPMDVVFSRDYLFKYRYKYRYFAKRPD
jgi:hypothetical protein